MKMSTEQEKTGYDIQHRHLIYSACILISVALMSTYVAVVALHHVLALKGEISSMREELDTYKLHLEALTKLNKAQAANWSISVNQLDEVFEEQLYHEAKSRDGMKLRIHRSLPEQAQQACVQLIASNVPKRTVRVSNCQKCIPGRPQQSCRVERRADGNQNQMEATSVPWILSLKKGRALDKKATPTHREGKIPSWSPCGSPTLSSTLTGESRDAAGAKPYRSPPFLWVHQMHGEYLQK
ncbi:uncharacterized protein [Mobula birostris]|uniref:uncharacterized protein n=1 Tax=Mobula birostris TaxID=1983395 RepID=UPI003B27E11D